MFLLLERGLWVLNQAQSVVLHPQELNVIGDSLENLWEPIEDRASKLRCEYIIFTHNRTSRLHSYLLFSYLLYAERRSSREGEEFLLWAGTSSYPHSRLSFDPHTGSLHT